VRKLAMAIVLSGLLTATASWSQEPTPQGDQFQVNTYTASNQGNPSVAVDPLGNFIVVWQSTGSFGNDSSGDSIQAQHYDANGNPLGAQFQVNTETTSSQREASVAMDGQGNFVVVWRSPDGDSWGIHGQRFDSDRDPVGTEFEVNTYTTDEQSEPAVAMDKDGNFVVVWESLGSLGTDADEESVQGQLYDAMGAPIGGQFQVNTSTNSRQESAKVAFDGQGNFVVVWDHVPEDSARGQMYDKHGAAVGGEFQLETSGYGSRPDVAADSVGNFVVAWTGAEAAGTDTFESSIQAQRYDINGNPVGGQFQVNTFTMDWQEHPSVSMDPQGNFLIVWQSEGSLGTDAQGDSVQAQYFDASGTPVGGEFQINSVTDGNQRNPFVDMDGTGDFVVVWDSDYSPTDPSSRSVHARRYSTAADLIFSDGFDSGSASAWSTTVP
jgi:hypothetical protein